MLLSICCFYRLMVWTRAFSCKTPFRRTIYFPYATTIDDGRLRAAIAQAMKAIYCIHLHPVSPLSPLPTPHYNTTHTRRHRDKLTIRRTRRKTCRQTDSRCDRLHIVKMSVLQPSTLPRPNEPTMDAFLGVP